MTIKNVTLTTALAGLVALGGSFAAAPAGAQPYGRDGGDMSSSQGYGWSGPRPDVFRHGQRDHGQRDQGQGNWQSREDRDMFERGFRMGRIAQHRRDIQAMHRMEEMRNRGAMSGSGQSASGDDEGVLVLLIERDRQQQAMRDVRQSLQEARAALQKGDRTAAEQALNDADQTLQQANALRNQQRIMQSLNQAEQALQSGNRMAAQQALQNARQAMNDAGSQQSPLQSSGSTGSSGSTSPGSTSPGSTGQGGGSSPSSR